MRLALPVVTLSLLFATSGPAHAALKLCNRTSYVLYAATSSVSGAMRVTEGWTRIAPGDCEIAIAGPLKASAYYVYAHSSLAYSGAARAWGGNDPICAEDGNFSSSRPATAFDCGGEMFDRPFASINTKRKSDWTMTFDESPGFVSLAAAELAGVKRLLGEIGYKIGAIDAMPGKATETALDAFRARMHFAPDAGNAQLFDALETEALKSAAPDGYMVCNDTTGPVTAALGEKDGADWVSRGWWTIAAGNCARLLDALTTENVYLLAERRDGKVLVGGREKFCVADIEFEIRGRDRCAARGLAETGFAPTFTGGLGGYAAHVGDGGLLPPVTTRYRNSPGASASPSH